MNIIKTFTNQHGSLTLRTVREFEPVKSLRCRDKTHMFDMDTAERIACITDNHGVQVAFVYPLTGEAYVVLHDSPSSAALCHVDNLDWFDNVHARRVIQDAAPKAYSYGVQS